MYRHSIRLTNSVLTKYAGDIKMDTLADELQVADVKGMQEVEINGENLEIERKKISKATKFINF